jgi:hypothetical protein
MADRDAGGSQAGSRGCLATGFAAVALTLLSPFVVAVQSWKRWRRGTDVIAGVHTGPPVTSVGTELFRIDIEFDVPGVVEADFRRRLTGTVVRVAEALRVEDDVYHLIYRLPWDAEPVLLPVGPKLQELGERFSLLQSRGAMAGRTAVWLTLGREHALSEIVDPLTYDPEADGEPEGVLTHAAARWSMATEWARVGASLVVRLILFVPPSAENRVVGLFEALTRDVSER